MFQEIKAVYIEDNPGDQVLMENYLSKTSRINVDLKIAGNLKEGIHLISTLEPHLVMVDLGLPDSSQDETLKRLSQIITKEAVIVISNNQNPETMFGSLKHGVQEYLLKDKLNSFELEKAIYFSMERKKVENTLINEQEQYKTLFQINPESILISRVSDGEIVSINKNFEKVFGWSQEDCVGRTTLDLNFWVDLNQRREIFSSLPGELGLKRFNTSFYTKLGLSIPCQASFTTYRFEGEYYIMGIIVSLSELYAQKRELDLEKGRFKALIESGADIFFYTQSLDHLDYVSPQVTEHLGYSSDEILTMDPKNLLTKSSFDKYREINLGEFFKRKEHLVISPFEFKSKEGVIKEYELRLIPVFDQESEKVAFVQGVARDISNELKTFKLLEHSNEQNIKALEELKTHQYAIDQHNMVVITDIDGYIKFANDNFCERSGYATSELIGKRTSVFKSREHDDHFFAEMWTALLAGKVWKGNICNRHKNGSTYWLATTIIPRLNKIGEVEEFIALRTDITELKKTEEALLESESTLRNVLDSNPHEFWSVNTKMELVTLNQCFKANFKAFFGHDLLLGEKLTEISGFDADLSKMWELRYQKAFAGETITYKDAYPLPNDKNKRRYLLVTVYPTYNNDRSIIGAGVFSQDISERERAKENLRESNLRLQSAQSQARIGDWYFNIKTDDFFWSKNLNEVLCLGEDFGTPNDVQSLLGLVSEEHRDLIQEAYQNTLSTGENQQVIAEFKPQEGKCLWLECSFSLSRDTNNEAHIIKGVIRDVDDLMRSRQRENLQKELFIALANNGASLLRLNSIEGVFQSLANSLFDWFKEEVVVITGSVISNDDTETFSLNNALIPEQWQREFEFLNKSIEEKTVFPAISEIRKGLKDGMVIHIDKDLIPLLPFLSAEKAESLLKAMPQFSLVANGLFYNDDLRGFCFILFPNGQTESYSDQLLEILAYQASSVMDILVYRNELKQNSLVLNQSLEAAQAAVWRYDFRTELFTGDERLFEMLGLDPKETVNLRANELAERFNSAYNVRMAEIIKPKLNSTDNYYKLQFLFHCFDGEDRFFEDRGKITQRDEMGNPQEIIGIRTDISQRKAREEQLLLLESSVKNANEGILITDANVTNSEGPRIVFANEAMSKISGYSVAELIGNSPKMLQGPLTDPLETSKMSKAFANFQKVETEIVNYSKDGRPYYISLSIVPIKNKQGEVTHFVALERDTTEERKQKEAIQEYLTRFELIARISKIGIYDLDPNTGKVIWDAGMYDLYEKKPDAFDLSIETWNNLLPKEDKKYSLDLFNSVLEDGSDEFNLTFKVPCESGLKHVQAIAKIFRDDEGKPNKVLGLNWDITELEQRRIELDRLRLNTQALINSTSDHMWSIDLRYRLLSANDSYLSYLNSLMDRNFSLKDNMLDPSFGTERNKKWKNLYDRAIAGEKVNVEMRESRADDQSQVLVISLYPIRNSKGLITGIACYSFDNTENVHYIETIQKQNERLKEIAWMQSHVMRAPVARVLGLIELLKDEDQGHLNQSVREILNFIQESSEEMDEVIREITSKTDRFGISLE